MNFFDAHGDTITSIMEKKEELFDNSGHIDIKRMLDFDSFTQIFAIWINKKIYNNTMEQTLKAIDFFYYHLNKNKEFISLVTCADELIYNKNRLRAILALEGGDAVNSLNDIHSFYNLGVRLLTLTWNNNNKIANGCSDNSSGLSNFGTEVVYLMNDLHMIIDVSHLSDKSFWDVSCVSRYPFIASHSNVRAICNVNRNLSDEQIKRVAECNGVIGINFYPSFIKETGFVTSDDIISHIDYIIKLIGEDYVGIGSDFDGIDQTPLDIRSVTDFNIIKNKLDMIYPASTVDKILYKNFERVVCEILK